MKKSGEKNRNLFCLGLSRRYSESVLSKYLSLQVARSRVPKVSHPKFVPSTDQIRGPLVDYTRLWTVARHNTFVCLFGFLVRLGKGFARNLLTTANTVLLVGAVRPLSEQTRARSPR